jgi:OFA family oxalate/formate antiporter-like MFS transporter
MPALGFALSVGLILNGLSRPFFGSLSDYAGRENTMLIAFLLEGVAIFALLWFAADPLMFVLLSGLVYFAWGQIFALFPATCTDLYGNRFATTNYSMLYTAKGTAALLVPLGNVLTTATGGWTTVFMVASTLSILAALIAFAVLKPMRMRAIAKDNPASPDAA